MKKSLFLILTMIISLVFPVANAQEKESTAPVRKINVDWNAEKGPHGKAFKECIGAGLANERFR
jgi:hypothetical protein